MGGNRQTCFQASFLSSGLPFRASEIACAAEHVSAVRIHVYGGKSADLVMAECLLLRPCIVVGVRFVVTIRDPLRSRAGK